MPISSDSIYNSNFNGKTIFYKNDLFCKIFTKYTYINLILMLYKWIYVTFRFLKNWPQLHWCWTIFSKCLVTPATISVTPANISVTPATISVSCATIAVTRKNISVNDTTILVTCTTISVTHTTISVTISVTRVNIPSFGTGPWPPKHYQIS